MAMNTFFHLIRLIIFSLLISCTGSYAQSITDMYEARVAIENYEEGSLKQDLQQALAQILVKLTGNHKILETKPSLKQIADPSKYIDSYQYDTVGEQDYFIASFNAASLSELLQKYGLKVWSGNRPDFLAWILLEADGKQDILSSEIKQEATTVLNRHAQQRGLPVLLPLMDFEDHRTLKIQDIVDGNKSVLLHATERYGAGAVLVGQVLKTFENQWLGKWRLLLNHEEKTWEATYPDLPQALRKGLDEAVDFIATKGMYIVVTEEVEKETVPAESSEESFELQVSNVLSLSDYSQVATYLHKVDVIKRLQMKEMSEEGVTFIVSVQGGKAAVINALNLGGFLVPSQENSAGLIYKFIPN